MADQTYCACCGEPCPKRYPNYEYPEEDEGEPIQGMDKDGNLEYLCCECAG